ncbi:hypothetical protein DFH08DRAFT_1076383 [Mycena albidolilacea]|uniref:Uncharacterized protein n=1 Tax=Mycena albidolilacea TaxID=1033008 RepID=A0AAD7ACI7_9AGAR|nr:hypothetical protein DFH08DRAFT_1076383 [Mycena albidolilacea]
MSHGTLVRRHARDTARRWRAPRCTSGVWRGITSGYAVCVSGRACDITRVVENNVYGGVLWSIANDRAVPAPVGYAAERRAPSAVSNYGGSSGSQSNYCASSTNYPSIPPAHIHLVFLPVDACNPTSTLYSITPHSTSSGASVHNTPAPGPMPLWSLYAYGSSCERDSQSGESTGEEHHLPFSQIYLSA